MRKLFLIVVGLFVFIAIDAQQLTTPQPSPTQTLKQNFGLSSIELSYSRPSAKGRKIVGEVVPFGKVWRTGANNATTLTFNDEVIIGNKKIPAGKYGFVAIPDKDDWNLIITKQLDITSPDAYKQENDIVRLTAKSIKLPDHIETFTIQFANIKPNSCDLELAWENTAVRLPIQADIDSKVMAQISNLINKDNRPYFNAAMYYLDNGKDLNQALSWFDKAIEQNPKGFFIYHQKANALAKLGKKEEAKKVANRSIELAREAKNEDYIRLNEKLLDGLK